MARLVASFTLASVPAKDVFVIQDAVECALPFTRTITVVVSFFVLFFRTATYLVAYVAIAVHVPMCLSAVFFAPAA